MKVILFLLFLTACSSNDSNPSPKGGEVNLEISLISNPIFREGKSNSYKIKIINKSTSPIDFVLIDSNNYCSNLQPSSSCIVMHQKNSFSSIKTPISEIQLVFVSSSEINQIKNLLADFKENDFYQANTNFDLTTNLQVLAVKDDSFLRNLLSNPDNLSPVSWIHGSPSSNTLPFYFFRFFNLPNEDENSITSLYLKTMDLNLIINEHGVFNEDIYISKINELIYISKELISANEVNKLIELGEVFSNHYLKFFIYRPYSFNSTTYNGDFNYFFEYFNSCRSLGYTGLLIKTLSPYFQNSNMDFELEFLELSLSYESVENCLLSKSKITPLTQQEVLLVKSHFLRNPFTGDLRDILDLLSIFN